MDYARPRLWNGGFTDLISMLKKTNIQFGTVVKSLYDEIYADYEEYKKSGNIEEDIDE